MTDLDHEYSFQEIRATLRQVGQQIMKMNDDFKKRERQLIVHHGSSHTNLPTILSNDIILCNISGAQKTLSAIATGLSAVIVAEGVFRSEARHREMQERFQSKNHKTTGRR
jgi:hypothetical protein